jgi:hypothetical protein
VNDDELVERLRRALHTEADILTPGHGTPRVTPVSARPHRRLGARNGAYLLLAAVAVVAAVLVIGINLGRPHTRLTLNVGASPTASSPAPSRPRAARAPVKPTSPSTTSLAPSASSASTVAPPTTTTPPTAVAKVPAVEAVAADFVPLSATFVTANDGWVLGVQECAKQTPCLKLDVTTDRGATWRAEAGPPVSGLSAPTAGRGARPDLQVRFANSEIGWIFGTVDKAPMLYWTDDGGASWNPDPLPARFDASRIEDIETAAGRVEVAYVTSHAGVAVATAPVALGAPAWVESEVKVSGHATSAQLVIQAQSGWLVALDGTAVVGGVRIVGTTWSSWSPPCGAAAATNGSRCRPTAGALSRAGSHSAPSMSRASPAARLHRRCWARVKARSHPCRSRPRR